MSKKLSRAGKVRKLLAEGKTPREIATQMKITPQAVYNIRYQMNKKGGLGALKPMITAPKNKRVSKVAEDAPIPEFLKDKPKADKPPKLTADEKGNLVFWAAIVTVVLAGLVVLINMSK